MILSRAGKGSLLDTDCSRKFEIPAACYCKQATLLGRIGEAVSSLPLVTVVLI